MGRFGFLPVTPLKKEIVLLGGPRGDSESPPLGPSKPPVTPLKRPGAARARWAAAQTHRDGASW